MKLLITILLTCSLAISQAQPKEIIYGHKDGLALSMLMYLPDTASNGKVVVNVISGDWVSDYNSALKDKIVAKIYTQKGYTVFSVMHGSQPRYNISEALQDLKRAVRFTRYGAPTFKINPNSIGIVGVSSGGHLALLVATTGTDSAMKVTDEIDRVSDRLQAVGVFYPPTDLLNFGATGFAPVNDAELLTNFGVKAAFDFKTWDEKKQSYTYSNPEERMTISKNLSPIYAITKDDPPALLIHGDKDDVVPIQQSQVFFDAYKKANLTADLIIKKGEGHRWSKSNVEEEMIVKWFGKYLK